MCYEFHVDENMMTNINVYENFHCTDIFLSFVLFRGGRGDRGTQGGAVATEVPFSSGKTDGYEPPTQIPLFF